MSQFSIICAIEAGRLEAQTLLMLTTLKRFAGSLGASRIVAFQGRSGEEVSAATRKKLAALNVEYVYRPEFNRAPWFNYTNKIAAVRFAQEEFDTRWRIWLDSDIIFLDEPSFSEEQTLENTDFQARFEFLSPAMTQTDDTFASYWSQVCEICDVQIEDIGFYDLDLPVQRMKPYFNSGVFFWRAETDFAEIYSRNFYRLLDAKIMPRGIGPWFADQVSLTPTIYKLNLRWRMLSPADHLMIFTNSLENRLFLDILPRANLVHYSKSRNAPYRATLDPLLLARRPELEEVLRAHDTFDIRKFTGLTSKFRKYSRRMRQEIYARTCKDI